MDFQLSGEVSDETAQSIGKKLGAQTIMSGSITAIGNTYRLRIRAISVETAEILGMQNVDVAQDSRIAALTGTAYTGPAVAAVTQAPRAAASANTAQTPATVSASPSNSRYIELSSANWSISVDKESTARFSVNKEYIEGRETEVLNVNQNLASGVSRWAEVVNHNPSVVQKLKSGSGVRFKVLGDGKSWYFRIPVSEIFAEGNYHFATISTRKDRVVEVDISYTQLRQPGWGKRAAFNKNNIKGLNFTRLNDTPGGAGASTIKIFDIEIY
jgi:hypothetical protein